MIIKLFLRIKIILLLLLPGLNASQGGGGFYGDNQGGTQNTPSTGEKRRQRAQNLVPVGIKDILESRDELFQVEGMEVGMVTFCGIIEGADHQVQLVSLDRFKSYCAFLNVLALALW